MQLHLLNIQARSYEETGGQNVKNTTFWLKQIPFKVWF